MLPCAPVSETQGGETHAGLIVVSCQWAVATWELLASLAPRSHQESVSAGHLESKMVLRMDTAASSSKDKTDSAGSPSDSSLQGNWPGLP